MSKAGSLSSLKASISIQINSNIQYQSTCAQPCSVNLSDLMGFSKNANPFWATFQLDLNDASNLFADLGRSFSYGIFVNNFCLRRTDGRGPVKTRFFDFHYWNELRKTPKMAKLYQLKTSLHHQVQAQAHSTTNRCLSIIKAIMNTTVSMVFIECFFVSVLRAVKEVKTFVIQWIGEKLI